MIILESEKGIEKIRNIEIREFTRRWIQRMNDDDPQLGLYGSNLPIGSLGDVWIAENEEEIRDKDFIEIIQVNMKSTILFIGTWIPTDGTPCADIFISSEILSEESFYQFIEQSDEVIEIKSF